MQRISLRLPVFFEKPTSRLNSKANLYITCVYVYTNKFRIFRTAGCCCETHLSLRKKKAGRTGEDIEREADNGGDV